MLARPITLVAVAILLLLSNHSEANGAPSPIPEPNAALNHQLSAMAFAEVPRRIAQLAPQAYAPRATVDPQANSNWFTSPIFLAIAARYTTAEHILHYRHGGFDANFWGELNSSRKIRIEFSTRL